MMDIFKEIHVAKLVFYEHILIRIFLGKDERQVLLDERRDIGVQIIVALLKEHCDLLL